MRRIALVISSLGPGGAERVLSIMANHWAQAGWEVLVLTLEGGPRPPFYALHPRVRHRRLDVPGHSPTLLHAIWGNLTRVVRLRRALAAGDPTAVISFIDRTNVVTLLAAMGLGVPVLVTEHSDPLLNRIGAPWEWLRRWTYPRARRIVVLNERARRIFAPRFGDRVTVVPNPVHVPAAEALARRPPGPGRTVVAMGRLGPEKRFDLLLEAFARVSPKHPDWRLVILGEGPRRRELEALRDALGLAGKVELPGLAPDPYPVLAGSDLFVLSSQLEGFPMALCEAMACGLPVIATEYHEGVREIVRDGDNGVLVPPSNQGALAAAMDRLMSDDAERRRLAARAVEIRERFGATRVMNTWTALVEATAPAGPTLS